MRFFVAALGLSCALAFCGRHAMAADTASPATDAPIHVQSCTAGEQSVLENPKIGLRMSHVSAIAIVYTNDRAVAATEIRFRIRYGGQAIAVTDRGTFAAGQTFKREFSSFDAVYTGPAADCTPTSVVLSDGTRWSAPAEPAPAHR